MKKTVLELFYDDETSKYDIRSEFCPISGQETNQVETDCIIENLVETLLNRRDLELSKVIKMVTIADICSDIQPYEHIETLWHMMMHDYLPTHEKHFRRMKERLGLHAKVNEPRIFCFGDSKLS